MACLPPEIGNLSELIGLYVEGNQLTELPAEIGSLTKLAMLTLRENQLTQVPVELGNLCNLAELYLHGNKLDLPEEVYNLGPEGQLLYLIPPIAEPPDWRPPAVIPEDYYAQ